MMRWLILILVLLMPFAYAGGGSSNTVAKDGAVTINKIEYSLPKEFAGSTVLVKGDKYILSKGKETMLSGGLENKMLTLNGMHGGMKSTLKAKGDEVKSYFYQYNRKENELTKKIYTTGDAKNGLTKVNVPPEVAKYFSKLSDIGKFTEPEGLPKDVTLSLKDGKFILSEGLLNDGGTLSTFGTDGEIEKKIHNYKTVNNGKEVDVTVIEDYTSEKLEVTKTATIDGKTVQLKGTELTVNNNQIDISGIEDIAGIFSQIDPRECTIQEGTKAKITLRDNRHIVIEGNEESETGKTIKLYASENQLLSSTEVRTYNSKREKHVKRTEGNKVKELYYLDGVKRGQIDYKKDEPEGDVSYTYPAVKDPTIPGLDVGPVTVDIPSSTHHELSRAFGDAKNGRAAQYDMVKMFGDDILVKTMGKEEHSDTFSADGGNTLMTFNEDKGTLEVKQADSDFVNSVFAYGDNVNYKIQSTGQTIKIPKGGELRPVDDDAYDQNDYFVLDKAGEITGMVGSYKDENGKDVKYSTGEAGMDSKTGLHTLNIGGQEFAYKKDVYESTTQTAGSKSGHYSISDDGVTFVDNDGKVYTGKDNPEIAAAIEEYKTKNKALINQLQKNAGKVKNRKDHAEEMKIKKAREGVGSTGRFFSSILSQYQDRSATSNLLFGKTALDGWRESVDSIFAKAYLGIDYWASAICKKEFKKVSSSTGTAYIEGYGGTIDFYGHIEGTRTEPLPIVCDEDNPCVHGTCEAGTCKDGETELKERLYKISYGVRAPGGGDEKDTKWIVGKRGKVTFNIEISGPEKTVYIYNDFVKLEPGDLDQDIFIQYSPRYFEKACIRFGNPPIGSRSGEADDVCNRITGVDGDTAEIIQTGVSSEPSEDGASETNWWS